MNNKSIVFSIPYLITILFLGISYTAIYQYEDVLAQTITNDSVSTSLTAYNTGLGFVIDTEALNLSAGSNNITFEDVPLSIDPTSVYLEFMDECCNLLEQTFQYDLLNEQTLLRDLIGKEITLNLRLGGENTTSSIQMNNSSTTAYTPSPSFTGKLLAYEGDNFIISTITQDGNVHIIPRDRINSISIESLPKDFVLEPTLNWKIFNQQQLQNKGNETLVQVSYLTGGLGWNSNYILVLNENDSAADIKGWITLDNISGKSFKNVILRFLAGDVSVQRHPSDLSFAEPETGAADIPAESSIREQPSISEGQFFDYHLYIVNGTYDINDRESKQIDLLNARNVSVNKIYEYNIPGLISSNREDIPVSISIGFNNTEQEGNNNNDTDDLELGTALPQGLIRVYKQTDEIQPRQQLTQPSLLFIGEDSIDHTPINENISLQIGNAFNILGRTTLVSERHPTEDVSIGTYNVTLTNRNVNESATVLVNINDLFDDWRVLENTLPYEQKDATSIQFVIDLPINSQRSFNYTIEAVSPSIFR